MMAELIHAFTLVFAASAAIIFVLDRFEHPTLPAYILAGLVVSNYLPEEQFLSFSQLGIAFLVFIFGLKSDLGRIEKLAAESMTTTLVQVGVAGVSMYIIAQGLGLNSINSIYLAAAAAFSSSLVGLELIESEIRTDILHGRLSESIQLMQDSLALVVIAVISSSLTYQSILFNLSVLVGMVLSAILFRQIAFDWIAKLAEGSEELLMLTALTLLTFFISLSQFFEVSIVIGSFAAGLAVARFPHNIEILDSMGSLKDFFSAIFFVSLGALLVFPGKEVLLLTGILLVGTLLLNPVITALLLMTSGYDKRTAYLAGFGLDQISEFALIIAIQAYIATTIAPEVFQSIILAATATMIISSYTSRYEEEIYQKLSSMGLIEVNSRKINERTNIPANITDHVLLVGYDTQGTEIAEGMKAENQEFVIIENDPEKISDIDGEEQNYVFGDVMDDTTWDRARVSTAKLIVSTVPSWNISQKLLGLDTEADIILRSSEIYEAKKLLEQGAFYVNVPDILSSEELVDHIHGVMQNVNYREELRRRNLLEVRRQLQGESE